MEAMSIVEKTGHNADLQSSLPSLGVCNRRQWPDPHYEPYHNSQGYFCKVRVNNREYSTDVPYKSESLAREGAAMNAWMICRNFSHNDGMRPGARPGQRSANGAVQGLPVAIGTGRKVNRHSASSYESGSSDGLSTGSSSPKSLESGFDQQMRQVTHQLPNVTPRRAQNTDGYFCYCRRAPVRAYGRCGYCLQENGWA